jgi:hypothetical protein
MLEICYIKIMKQLPIDIAYFILLQFIAQATDGSRTANAYVTIKVLRNLAQPSFTVTAYTATILETQPVGVAISLDQNFVVADGDRQPPNTVVNYRLLNNLDHFQISETGTISVKNSLTASDPKSTGYQVKFY